MILVFSFSSFSGITRSAVQWGALIRVDIFRRPFVWFTLHNVSSYYPLWRLVASSLSASIGLWILINNASIMVCSLLPCLFLFVTSDRAFAFWWNLFTLRPLVHRSISSHIFLCSGDSIVQVVCSWQHWCLGIELHLNAIRSGIWKEVTNNSRNIAPEPIFLFLQNWAV